MVVTVNHVNMTQADVSHITEPSPPHCDILYYIYSISTMVIFKHNFIFLTCGKNCPQDLDLNRQQTNLSTLLRPGSH